MTSGDRVVGLTYLTGDAAAGGDLVCVLVRLGPDYRRFCGITTCCAGDAGAAAFIGGLTGGRHELAQRPAQLLNASDGRVGFVVAVV